MEKSDRYPQGFRISNPNISFDNQYLEMQDSDNSRKFAIAHLCHREVDFQLVLPTLADLCLISGNLAVMRPLFIGDENIFSNRMKCVNLFKVWADLSCGLDDLKVQDRA